MRRDYKGLPSASQRGRGNPKSTEGRAVLSKEIVEQALKDCRGLVTYAARKLKVDNAAIGYWVKKHPELKELKDQYETAMLDTAESNLWTALENGDPWATCFVLKTKGARQRGYTEKLDMKIEGQLNQKIVYQVVTGVPRDERDPFEDL